MVDSFLSNYLTTKRFRSGYNRLYSPTVYLLSDCNDQYNCYRYGRGTLRDAHDLRSFSVYSNHSCVSCVGFKSIMPGLCDISYPCIAYSLWREVGLRESFTARIISY